MRVDIAFPGDAYSCSARGVRIGRGARPAAVTLRGDLRGGADGEFARRGSRQPAAWYSPGRHSWQWSRRARGGSIAGDRCGPRSRTENQTCAGASAVSVYGITRGGDTRPAEAFMYETSADAGALSSDEFIVFLMQRRWRR